MVDKDGYLPPLDGVRVLDAINGPCEGLGAFLTELGADVWRVEDPRGAPSRTGLSFAVRNLGKRGVTADLTVPAGRARFDRLLAAADVFLDDRAPGGLDADGYSPDRLAALNPMLVTVSVTPFGQSGRYCDRRSTPDVLLALSGVLSRSGLPEVPEPLLPPWHVVHQSALMQAAWTVLLALTHARRRGTGDVVDFAVLDAMHHLLDPGYGIGGSARAGAPMDRLPRGRPDARHLYPTFPATDGDVRICVLSPRQWHGMLAWLGEPAELAGGRYDNLVIRQQADAVIRPYYERLFAALTRREAVEAGTGFGVPVAAVLDAREVLEEPAFAEAGTFRDLELGAGVRVSIPSGTVEIDGVKRHARTEAPALGADDDAVDELLRYPRAPATAGRPATGCPPFEGLRILDLGVIVVGAELGRLFADHGADVIKVESREFPDGSRQTYGDTSITEGFCWGHRNKRSLGLNLRSTDGLALFRELVAGADVVCSNFKPGTLEKLGLSYAELAAVNPRVILTESSAFGRRGPWRSRMGYGPLVRASSGLSRCWRYPDADSGYSDAITIYPDHVAARAIAATVAAMLLRRETTGRGGHISCAQIDVILTAMAEGLAAEQLRPGTLRAEGNRRGHDAPTGPFPAAGDDEWVVVDVEDTDTFLALARAIGRGDWAGDETLRTPDGRLARAAELEAGLAGWTARRDLPEIERVLHAAGVAAGRMVRVGDFPKDPHLIGRGLVGVLHQPQFDEPLPTLLAEARFASGLGPRIRPAPLQGEHTREIARSLAGLDDERIEDLVAAGVLQPATDPTRRSSMSHTPTGREEIALGGDGAVLAHLDGHVMVVTLNRPQARNAVDRNVTLGVGEALEVAEKDDRVWVVIVTGAGDRSFCAGADLKAAARGELTPTDERIAAWGFAGYVRHHISKPTIAAVNGFALGGGTEIVLQSDLAVAVDTATFGLPEVKRGIVAGAGGAFRLGRQIPRKVAMEVMLTAEPLSARRALEIGLVNRVVPAGQLMDAARELAGKICANAPIAVQVTKRIAQGLTDGRRPEEDPDWSRNEIETAALMRSEDAREGMAAFAEKRAPQWKGR